MIYHKHYSKKAFWDGYYEKNGSQTYDWLQSYTQLKDIFRIMFKSSVKLEDRVILDMGCGTSNILEKLYQDGHKKLIGIDFSETIINKMNQQYASLNKCFECELNSFPDGCQEHRF